MATFRPDINPSILRWAREWAGYTLEGMTEKEPKYEEWEKGDLLPTMKQLEKLSNRFHVPLGYFFLPEPPEIEVPIPDFRTVRNQHPSTPSPDLIEVLHQMMRRQDWMRRYLIEEGEEPLEFVGKVTIDTPIDKAASVIRETLGLPPAWATNSSNQDEALRMLREVIESQRIMVVIMGYAGNSTRRTLDVSEFRGFVLSDEYAPLIFVNGRDAKQAQMFTLAHELAHIWINQDALFDLPKLMPSNVESEIFCNKVAAEFLVPAKEFNTVWKETASKNDPYRILARRFKVSQIVIARRALDLEYINKDTFFEFYNNRLEEVAKLPQTSGSSGGNYWNTQGTRIGRLFGSAVIRAVKEGKLLYTDAYEMTGLRSSTLNSFADRLGLSL